MEFDEYLQKQLIKPMPGYYDPKGNSARAVVVRGVIGEIAYQYKGYPSYIKWVLGEFSGVRTTFDWVISVPILILFAPVIPTVWGISSHKRAIKEYRSEYKTWIRSKTKLNLKGEEDGNN